MIRLLAFLLALFAVPATAQVGTIDTTLQPGWNPAADYITVGQDEGGYRSWYMASLCHQQQVKAFNDYLETWQVSGVLPTWQILRTDAPQATNQAVTRFFLWGFEHGQTMAESIAFGPLPASTVHAIQVYWKKNLGI